MSLDSFIPKINQRAKDQDKDRASGGYQNKYFDENETRLGQEKYDLATGKAIKNDIDAKSPHAMHVDEHGKLQIKKELKDDPATALLREHGMDEFGNLN